MEETWLGLDEAPAKAPDEVREGVSGQMRQSTLKLRRRKPGVLHHAMIRGMEKSFFQIEIGEISYVDLKP